MLERAKGIEPSYAAWEGFDGLANSIGYKLLAPFWLRFFCGFSWVAMWQDTGDVPTYSVVRFRQIVRIER